MNAYDFKVKKMDGSEVSLERYRGKALLIVNDSEEPKTLATGLGDDFTVYLVDQDHFMTETTLKAAEFQLAAKQVALIRNY